MTNAVLGLAKAQDELGVEVAIAGAEPEGRPLYQPMQPPEGVRLFRWKPRWKVQLGSLTWRGIPDLVRTALSDFAPEVVHIHGEFNPDNLWVPHLFRHASLILSPHGAFHPVLLRKSRDFLKRFYVALARHWLYRHLHALHALNPAEAGHIRSLLGPFNVYIVPQGPSIHVQGSTGDQTKAFRRERTAGEIRLIFVGRLDVYTKGLDILLEAFAEAVQASKQMVSLTLVGPDWKGSMEILRCRVVELGLEGKVSFAGPVPGREVGRLLAQSDLYLLVSRHEGFPLSLCEALLLGKPAILSEAIGTMSYVEIANLPFVKVVPPDKRHASKAMIEAIHQLPRLKASAQQSLERVRRFFDWHEIAKQHLDFYKRLTSRS